MVHGILLFGSDYFAASEFCGALSGLEDVKVFMPLSACDALSDFNQNPIEIAIIDIDTGEGLGLLHEVQSNRGCYVIVCSNARDFDVIYRVTRYPDTMYILKNEGIDAVVGMVQMVLQKINGFSRADRNIATANHRLMEVSEMVSSQSDESSSNIRKLADRIKAHIRKNIFSPDHITLPHIAEMVHFNPSYLSRLFKKVTNISISDYVMECKITSAKKLLADSDTQIQKIAESLGYTSQSNFARVFKKATGMTPNEYRSQSAWGDVDLNIQRTSEGFLLTPLVEKDGM